MSKDPIVQIGDPVLRAVAKPLKLKDISARPTKSLIAKMKRALASEEYGVAIAAPQVGASLRLFVVAGKVFKEDEDAKDEPTPSDRVYINPEITRRSKKQGEMAEGCLSVRGQYGTVMRHEKVTLKALDEGGKPILQHASGLLAHIFQHETDHLDGILYIDKAARLTDDSERAPLREESPA
ncbi:MAG TPA: peptide deformylase [Candidatus Paceibacterota bacterium]|nr:peptide deformylase [Candidatus Paceibacterota bacterium]